jgi:ATP-dependent RNA helicase DDX42
MGIFDECSSEDDENDDNEQPTTTQQHNQDHVDNNEQIEEEDPLDAYMKSIQVEPIETETTTTAIPSRFDPDDEEDEHERIIMTDDHRYEDDDQAHDDDDDDDNKIMSSQRLYAKKALDATFRKASHTESIVENATASTTALRSLLPVLSTIPFQSKFWDGDDTILGRNWRRDHDIQLRLISNQRTNHVKHGIGENTKRVLTNTVTTMDPILHFQQLSSAFGESLMQQILVQKYTAPTLVQAQTLPIALSGLDGLITAATGQGKTLAYIWPICVHLLNQPPLLPTETGPLALVLVPTRELALQVQQHAKPMLNSVRVGGHVLRSRAVIGGQGKYMLLQELKKTGGIELVIATPGRLLDVLSDTKGLSMKRVTFVVLDEADKMLHMGFEKQVNQILQQIRPDRQTLMLSATMGSRIEKVASEWLRSDHAIRISIGRTGQASENVEQHVMVLPNESAKESFLIEMLPVLNQVGRTIVFVSTRIKCEKLAELVRVRASDTHVLTLHGDKHQTDRTAAVRDFAKGIVKILIATDVAARGLDIPNVQTVLSFDPAKDLDSHVHRLGRAGRLSKETNQQTSGSAYTLLTESNADFAHVLLGALEREGKPASPELIVLAGKSRRRHRNINNVDCSRSKKEDKSGLGFVEQSYEVPTTTTTMNGGATSNVIPSYSVSIDMDAPPAKRYRNT